MEFLSKIMSTIAKFLGLQSLIPLVIGLIVWAICVALGLLLSRNVGHTMARSQFRGTAEMREGQVVRNIKNNVRLSCPVMGFLVGMVVFALCWLGGM
ncbi:hypothetical protein AAU61_13730 [Desulfocarbo indianensis]|nr:hypothetical protein AAU61_13730 [Desulfocarbo indianensis]